MLLTGEDARTCNKPVQVPLFNVLMHVIAYKSLQTRLSAYLMNYKEPTPLIKSRGIQAYCFTLLKYSTIEANSKTTKY